MSPWLARRWYDLGYFGCFWTFGTLFSLRTQGGQHIPKTGPVLLVCNHQSFLDPVLLGIASTRRVSYLARETLFKKRLPSWLMRSYGALTIDHKGFSREGLQATIDYLHQGKCIGLFPEGERTHDGKLEAFKPGISLFLKRVKAPIVPAGIMGAYAAFPRTRKWPRMATRFSPASEATIAVSIGRPIDPAKYVGWPREDMLADLQRAVQLEMDRAERLRRKDHSRAAKS